MVPRLRIQANRQKSSPNLSKLKNRNNIEQHKIIKCCRFDTLIVDDTNRCLHLMCYVPLLWKQPTVLLILGSSFQDWVPIILRMGQGVIALSKYWRADRPTPGANPERYKSFLLRTIEFFI